MCFVKSKKQNHNLISSLQGLRNSIIVSNEITHNEIKLIIE